MRLLGDRTPLLFPKRTEICYTTTRRDGRVVYCDCLENSWVHSPGGSNPSPSAIRVGCFPPGRVFFAHLPLRAIRETGLFRIRATMELPGEVKKNLTAGGAGWTDRQTTLRAFEGDVYANVSFGGSGHTLCVMFIFGRTVKYCVTHR